MSDYENVNMTPDYENVKADYTPTTEEIESLARAIDPIIYPELNPFKHGWTAIRRIAKEMLSSKWLAEHDRQKQAEAWDAGANCRKQDSLLGKHLEQTWAKNPYRQRKGR